MNKLKIMFTIYTTKLLIKVLKLTKNGGTTLPGRYALKICPDILKETSRGYKTIFITGTNGKTTTSKMVTNMIKGNGCSVISNDAGANMKSGITTTFIKNYSNKKDKGYAIIEIDEANLRLVSDEIDVSYVLITNIFRDQLDRYGEVYTTLAKILDGIKSSSTKLILNGDEPLFGNIDIENEKLFYGIDIIGSNEVGLNVEGKFCVKCGSPYSYNFVSYSHLGDYFCTGCGYKRPHIDFLSTNINFNGDGTTSFEYKEHDVSIKLSGLYNVYNATSALSVIDILGLDLSKSIKVLENESSPFGRQEEIDINGKKVKLMLAKNPAGFNEAISTVNYREDEVLACFILNDKQADGRDVSWIYDVNYESIVPKLSEVFVGGTRGYDMAIRINTAGVPKDKINVFQTHDELINMIGNCNVDKIDVFSTYTAMMEFRKYLYEKKYINKLY